MIKFLLQRPIAVLMALRLALSWDWLLTSPFRCRCCLILQFREITVQVSGQNTSARELENTVVKTIRQQLMQVASLRDIHSETRDGAAIIRLNFDFRNEYGSGFYRSQRKDRRSYELPAT